MNGAQITPRMLTFVKKLVSTFGIGFESGSSVYCAFSLSASESLARRAQATAQDPVFVKLKEQFVEDFDFGFVSCFFVPIFSESILTCNILPFIFYLCPYYFYEISDCNCLNVKTLMITVLISCTGRLFC